LVPRTPWWSNRVCLHWVANQGRERWIWVCGAGWR
jgi:hypothetical protein